MSENSHPSLDIEDFINPIISEEAEKNRRITVRYVREDIKASLSKVNIFFHSSPLNIQLLDLSTKGALIHTDKKIRNKKLVLILEFEDGRIFEINANIVRMDAFMDNTYGIKFEKYNNELGDYILKTQTDLIFK